MDTLRYLVGEGEHGHPTGLVLAESGQRCYPTPRPCRHRHPPDSAPFAPSPTPFASTVAYHNGKDHNMFPKAVCAGVSQLQGTGFGGGTTHQAPKTPKTREH